jgi:hypothetical protein
LVAVNISRAHADGCVGAVETRAGAVTMLHTVVIGATARAHHGAFMIRYAPSIGIHLCVFAYCQHTSANRHAGCVLSIMGRPRQAHVNRSAFIDNHQDRTCTIAFPRRWQVQLTECCFTGSEKVELADREVMISACSFADQRCNLAIDWTVEYRYGPGQTEAVTAFIAMSGGPDDSSVWAGRHAKIAWALMAVTISALSAGVMTGLQLQLQEWWRRDNLPRSLW